MLKHIENFGGIAPAVDPRLTKDSIAMKAENVDVSSGKIVPVHSRASATIPADESKSGTWHWLNTDFVRSPINDDKMKRTYYVPLTGTNAGHLYHKGTIDSTPFDVEVRNNKPSAAPGATVVPVFTGATSSATSMYYIGSFTAGWGPRYAYCGRNTTDVTEDLGNPRHTCSVTSVSMTGNVAKVTVHYPGSYLVGTTSDGGEFMPPQKKGTLFLGSGSGSTATASANSTYFNFESAYTPSYITIYRADGSPYARLHVSSCAVTNVDWEYGTTTKPLHPPTGKVVRGFYYPGDLILTCNIEYADTSSYRYYLWTYSDVYGQESPNSDMSSMISCRTGDTVTVTMTGIPAAAKKVNLYRTAGSVSQNSASFYYCYEFDLSKTLTSADPWTKTYDSATGTYTIVFTDTVTDDELAEEHLDVVNPPTDLIALDQIHGSLVGARAQEVCFSEPYMPFDWDNAYTYTPAHPVVGLAVSGSSVFVLTTGEPEILKGTHPGQMSQYHSAWKQACVSKASIVSCEGVVYYASPDGIVAMDETATCTVLTENLLSRNQWQHLGPTTMIFAVHDRKIVVFTASHGTLVYDLSSKTLTTEEGTALDVYSDVQTDILYLRTTTPDEQTSAVTVVSWRDPTATDPARLTATWRSNIFTVPRPVAWSAARIVGAPNSSITLKIYSVSRADSSAGSIPDYDINDLPYQYRLCAEKTITSERAVRLPFMRKELEWFIEITETSNVYSVDLATSMGDIQKGVQQ